LNFLSGTPSAGENSPLSIAAHSAESWCSRCSGRALVLQQRGEAAFGISPLSSANIVNSTRIRKPLVVSAL
jgi:hypothetical protein